MTNPTPNRTQNTTNELMDFAAPTRKSTKRTKQRITPAPKNADQLTNISPPRTAPRPDGMNRRFARSPFMEQQNKPPQDQSPVNRAGPLVEPVAHPDQGQDGAYSAQNPIPAAENWDSRPPSRPLLLIIAIVGVVAVILFALSMCTASTSRMAADGTATNPAAILQNNVNEAFSVGNEPGTGDIGVPQQQPAATTTTQPQTQSNNAGSSTAAAPALTPTPEDIQRQQELQAQQEEMLQQQRNAVPSLLPENPPAPAALGAY